MYFVKMFDSNGPQENLLPVSPDPGFFLVSDPNNEKSELGGMWGNLGQVLKLDGSGDKLFYLDNDGFARPLTLGPGLAFSNGVLSLTQHVPGVE